MNLDMSTGDATALSALELDFGPAFKLSPLSPFHYNQSSCIKALGTFRLDPSIYHSINCIRGVVSSSGRAATFF